MRDWQKTCAADRADIERRAESIGIGSAARAYFARVQDQWSGRDGTVEAVGREQFMRDASNVLEEQVAELERMCREFKLSAIPNPAADMLETPLDQGLYFVEDVD